MVGSKLKYLEPLVEFALALWLSCHVTWHTLSIEKILASLIIGNSRGGLAQVEGRQTMVREAPSSILAGSWALFLSSSLSCISQSVVHP